MTLIELLIAVAIIGIIAAFAVPNLLQSMQRAKINRTFADLSAIKTALGTYLTDHGHYPIVSYVMLFSPIDNSRTRLETLTSTLLPEKYYTGSLRDAWGNGYDYISDALGEYAVVISYGTDQRLGWPISRMTPIPRLVFTNLPWLFRGWWPGMRCPDIAYEDINNIIEYGCDLVIMNGQQLGTR